MKILMSILALLLCLGGCSNTVDFETVADAQQTGPTTAPGQIHLELPEQAQPSMQTQQAGQLYLCEDYSITVQTLPSGDLEKTLLGATGHSFSQLSPIKTQRQQLDCYDCVWTAAGEGQTQTGRLRLLDDGAYHYVVSVLAPAKLGGQLQEQIGQLMRSVRIMDPDFDINIGS